MHFPPFSELLLQNGVMEGCLTVEDAVFDAFLHHPADRANAPLPFTNLRGKS